MRLLPPNPRCHRIGIAPEPQPDQLLRMREQWVATIAEAITCASHVVRFPNWDSALAPPPDQGRGTALVQQEPDAYQLA